MVNKILLPCFVTLLLLSIGAYAEIYRWQDAQGKTHFSDKAPEDQAAENIEKKIKSRANVFSDDVQTQQARLLAELPDKLQPSDPDKPELFLITFGGDAKQAVFMRETLYIQDLFHKRYNTEGHSVALINHASTTSKYLVATDTNLELVLKTYSALMNDDDVLYLYLTSHGSRTHKLTVDFPPYAIQDFGPNEIRQMLDDAGIKWRVIVVSACYAGGFVAPLQSPNTLIATAADATHTSFGCADDRDFTYYGEAIFKNLMSARGLGLVSALDQARNEVYAMEDAMHTDHHSNPQFFEGAEIHKHLLQFDSSQTLP